MCPVQIARSRMSARSLPHNDRNHRTRTSDLQLKIDRTFAFRCIGLLCGVLLAYRRLTTSDHNTKLVTTLSIVAPGLSSRTLRSRRLHDPGHCDSRLSPTERATLEKTASRRGKIHRSPKPLPHCRAEPYAAAGCTILAIVTPVEPTGTSDSRKNRFTSRQNSSQAEATATQRSAQSRTNLPPKAEAH